MLVLQAVPLSLSILWRYMMILPGLMIGLFLYGILGGLIGVVIGLIIPGAYLVILFAVSASSSIIPILVGTRLGFAAKEIGPSNGVKKLVLPAVAYGLVEALSLTLLLVPATGMMVFTSAPNLSELVGTPNFAPSGIANMLENPSGLPTSGLILFVFIAVCAIRACLLVPIASASIGRDPDDRPYTPFRHFAAEFWPLFVLVLLSFVGMLIIFTLVSLTLPMIGMDTVISEGMSELGDMVQGTAPFRPIWPVFALIVAYILIGFWALSLQCAGGVLGYLRLRGTPPPPSVALQFNPQPNPHPSTQSGPRMSAEELRALRKSRESTYR